MANDIIDIIVTDNSDNVQLNVTPNLVSINVSQTSGNIIGSNYYLSSTYGALPVTGDTTTLYVINDTSLMYRWSGSAYVQINSSAVVAWGQITGALSGQTDLTNTLNAKAPLASPTFTGTVSGITKAMVGLSNVDNTTDANKPISTATQTALDTKAPLASPTFTGTVSGITKSMVGLGNVDNTTDLLKPISTATQSALNLKYDASNPSGYISGITSGQITTALGYTPENSANKGIANGYASLDGGGLVPSTQLPSYVDDVLEFANLAGFPASGTTGKIYVALDTNKIYRWSGATYIEVSPTVGTIWGGITGTLSNQTDLQNALNLKYNTPTGDTTQYVAGDGSLITFPVLASADKLILVVRNTSGATITKGTVVYINGASGNKPTIAKALATSDATSAQTLGLVQANIANNSNGNVVLVGSIIDLDTSAFTEGQQLYLSGVTAGTYTATKTLAPTHLVYVGVIARAHATQGVIEVKIQNGYELDEIHDVSIVSEANNEGLFYESSTNLWKNKSIATVLGYTPSNDSLVVHLAGTETITGAKTFSDTLTVATGSTKGIYFSGTKIVEQNVQSGYTQIALQPNSGNKDAVFMFAPSGTSTTSSMEFYASSAFVSTTRFQFKNFNGLLKIGADTAFLPVSFITNATEIARFSGTNGNLLLNTTTDAGYRLDAFGLTRFTGTTASDTAPLGSELAAVTGTGTNWALAGGATNLNVGGYAHTVGSVVPLTTTLAAVNGTYYQITYTITGRTAGSITIAYGGTSTNTSASGNTGPLASSTAVLTITPTTDFDGTIVLSIKTIGTSSASSTFANSSAGANIEVRASSLTNNTFIGIDAGRRNTTGGQNTFIGYSVGVNNTTGSTNTFIGNTVGISNAISIQNTFIGQNVGNAITIGRSNVFIGQNVGNANTIGTENIFIGQFTGNANISGSDNTFIGINSGNNSTANFNTFYGAYTGTQTTTGAQNTFLGISAGQLNTTGSNNTFIGFSAGRNISGGSTSATILNNSIMVGYQTKPLADNQTNQIVIGYDVTGLGSNTTVLGNSSTTTTAIYGNLSLGSTVDAGYKLDVTGTARVSGAATFSSSVTAGSSGQVFVTGNAGTASIGMKFTNTGGNSFIGLSNSIGTGYLSGTAYAFNIQTEGAQDLQFGTNNANRMIITSAGNVGIGNTGNASRKLEVTHTTGYSAGIRIVAETGPGDAKIQFFGGGSSQMDIGPTAASPNDLIFGAGGSERMRITSGGTVLIGSTTSTGATITSGSLQVNREIISVGPMSGLFWENRSGGVTASANWYGFYTSSAVIFLYNGSANIASINSTTGVYTPLSDRNKKKDFEDSKIGLKEILQLKPTLYRMKTDYSEGIKELGFIAQDVKEIIPAAYTENEDFIGLNFNPIVAALTKAIQELSAEITILKNK